MIGGSEKDGEKMCEEVQLFDVLEYIKGDKSPHFS